MNFYQDQLRDTKILAPVDGVIVNKALEVGEWVTPGTPILTVDDLSTIWARVDVQETDLGSIYIGKPARVRLPTNPPLFFRRSQTAWRLCGSSPIVGSSRNRTSGEWMRPRAISSRRRIPPE